MINNENYEGYLMRYVDGVLAPNEVAEVEAYLDQHPDLRKEMEELASPTLRVTAPLATMPDKERMMQKEAERHLPIWTNVAAAMALFITAGIIVRSILNNGNDVVTTANIDSIETIASDTILPDSLYIDPGRREPIYLAENREERTENREQKTMNEEIQLPEYKNDLTPDLIVWHHDTLQHLEKDIPPLTQNTSPKTQQPNTPRLIAGRVIIIETDQLVRVEESRLPANRPGVTTGRIIENSALALNEETSFAEKIVYALNSLVKRHTKDSTDILATL